MITYSIKPILIPLGECSTDWLAVCIPAALSVEDWEIGETDDITLLPQALKNERYHAVANRVKVARDGTMVDLAP